MRGISLRWACVCAALLLFLGPATGAALAAGKPFSAPVNAEVTRKFEAPSHKFGPGHRGIDYGVPSGTTVRASGEGSVTFAGQVADDGLFVTIEHLGGISTTYSYLSQIDVSRGDRVTQGQAIARSGEGHRGGPPALHFGAKKNGDYVDPEILLGGLDDVSKLLELTPINRVGSGGTQAFIFNPEIGDFPTGSLFSDPGIGKQGSPGRVVPIVDAPVPPLENDGGSSGMPGSLPPRPSVGRSDIGGPENSLSSGSVGIGGSTALGFRTKVRPTENSLTRLGEVRNQVVVSFLHRSSSGKVKDATSKGIGFKERLARWADALGDRNLRFADEPGAEFSATLFGGAFKQAACWLRGGATAPDFETGGFEFELPFAPKPKVSAIPPPNDNIVVAVAGITTQTEDKSRVSALYQDSWWKSLGYDMKDVYYFSYKGPLSASERAESGSFSLHDPYSSDDTYQPLEDSALQLQQQIDAIHRSHPGKQIDIIAHSQGGAVSQFYLTYLYRGENVMTAKEASTVTIENFLSISSPHLGAEGARGYSILADTAYGKSNFPGIQKMTESIGLPRGDEPSSMQLDPDSFFVKRATRDWDPKKVRATTIATPFDLAVMPDRTRLKGANHYTVWVDPLSVKPWGHHSAVIWDPETKAIIYNALRRTPSQCTGFLNAVSDEMTGSAVGKAQVGLLKGLDFVVNAPWD